MKVDMNLRKEVKEWGVFVVIIATLYLTGLHTNVAAFAQRMVLSAGFITPNIDLPEEDKADIDYNFKLQDMEGNIISLESFRNKVIFINEWATWCAPCIAEMPGIQSLYDEMKDKKDLVFVMLSLDTKPGKISKFIDKKGYTFPVYVAASQVPDVLRSPSIPTTFVVSKTGKIVSKKVGMAKYDTKKFKNFLLEQVNSD